MGADSMRVITQRTLRTGTHKIHTCTFLKQTHMRRNVYRHYSSEFDFREAFRNYPP